MVIFHSKPSSYWSIPTSGNPHAGAKLWARTFAHAMKMPRSSPVRAMSLGEAEICGVKNPVELHKRHLICLFQSLFKLNSRGFLEPSAPPDSNYEAFAALDIRKVYTVDSATEVMSPYSCIVLRSFDNLADAQQYNIAEVSKSILLASRFFSFTVSILYLNVSNIHLDSFITKQFSPYRFRWFQDAKNRSGMPCRPIAAAAKPASTSVLSAFWSTAGGGGDGKTDGKWWEWLMKTPFENGKDCNFCRKDEDLQEIIPSLRGGFRVKVSEQSLI